MRMNKCFLIPMAALLPPAVYVGGIGLSRIFGVPLWAGLTVSVGLHAAWLFAAVERFFLLLLIGWLCSLRFAAAGNAIGASGALLIEILLLLLALGLRPGVSFAEWLANHRRTRTAIQVQLMLAEGMLPWVRNCTRQFVYGEPSAKEQTMSRGMFLAELEDADRASTAISVVGKRDNL